MCIQRKASKKIVNEQDSIQANIDSFGDDIGKTTNRITSMFDIQAKYAKDTKEYKELEYRIQCGQLYQQNAIDKTKGIISKPMPKEWYDYHSAIKITDVETRDLYLSILADKKPYFMRYIYPDLMQKYNTYIRNTEKNALREFQMTVDDLLEIPKDKLNDRQREFLHYYNIRMPVSTNNCVMNRICRRFEAEFDGCIRKLNTKTEFDYTIMKSGIKYKRSDYNAVLKLYEDYNKRLRSFTISASIERADEYETFYKMLELRTEFEQECVKVSPDASVLCDIVLDICYTRSATKRFAWEVCGNEIIQNLLSRSDGFIDYPTQDADGRVQFKAKSFTMKKERIGEAR